MESVILAIYLGVLCVFDCRECRVPVVWLAIGAVSAALWVVGESLASSDKLQWTVLAALLGCLPGVFMLLVGWLSKKVGYGDGIVLICIGMVIGYKKCFAVVCGSLLLMSVVCMGLLLFNRGNRNTKIPYLPFLSAVYLLSFVA